MKSLLMFMVLAVNAHAAVNAPRGSSKPLDIPVQIEGGVYRCQGEQLKKMATRYYTEQEMSVYGLVILEVIENGESVAFAELRQYPKDRPKIIVGELYLIKGDSPIPVMATVTPIASMILGLGEEDLSKGQVSADGTGASSKICRNPLNENRYFLSLLKGNIQ